MHELVPVEPVQPVDCRYPDVARTVLQDVGNEPVAEACLPIIYSDLYVALRLGGAHPQQAAQQNQITHDDEGYASSKKGKICHLQLIDGNP